MTLAEVLIATGVFAVIVLAVAGLVGSSSKPAGVFEERGQAVVTAQEWLARMSDLIRTAQDDGSQLWVAEAAGDRLRFFTDGDGSGSPEAVTLALQGSELLYNDRVVAQSIVNASVHPPRPLFEYYTIQGAQAQDKPLLLAQPQASLGLINRVVIRLSVDPDPAPGVQSDPVHLEAVVMPRAATSYAH